MYKTNIYHKSMYNKVREKNSQSRPLRHNNIGPLHNIYISDNMKLHLQIHLNIHCKDLTHRDKRPLTSFKKEKF